MVTACPILYGDSQSIGDNVISHHKGVELEEGGHQQGCKLPEDRSPSELVLSFSPADLFELQWAVRCSHV